MHTQTFNSNLKELGVVESKRNIIRKGLVHDLLNAQDTVLCSYFAQRSGGEVDRGKEDCKQAAQANRLTLVLGQKGGSRVWQP